MSRLLPREAAALGALAIILAITALWWALALWPLPGDAPTWLLRTRAVCFGTVSNGMPTTAGWMALIGQPVYMLATLWLISGQSVAGGLRRLAASAAGRHLLRGAVAAVVVGLVAAGVRVAGAATVVRGSLPPSDIVAAEVPRLDEAPPPLALMDQAGQDVTLARFQGRPILLTFAYAHCETVCPLIVHDAVRARDAVPKLGMVLLVVTLDPWRDTPSRLSSIARQWKLGSNAHVLSGSVADVERTLDDWHIGRQRDLRTGELTHSALAYLLDRTGRVAFVVNGADAATLAGLARRL